KNTPGPEAQACTPARAKTPAPAKHTAPTKHTAQGKHAAQGKHPAQGKDAVPTKHAAPKIGAGPEKGAWTWEVTARCESKRRPAQGNTPRPKGTSVLHHQGNNARADEAPSAD